MYLPRILLTVPRLNMGGAESYVATLAVQLHQRGYTVVLASGGGMLARMLAKQGIRHYWVPFRASISISASVLKSILHREQIDLVHANSSVAGDATSLACTASKTPWLITAHGYGVNFPSSLSASRIICVSDFVRKVIQQRRPGIDDKLVTIYNGVNLCQFAEHQPKSLRISLQIPTESFCLGMVSRLNAKIWKQNKKGHQDLFSILAHDSVAAAWHVIVAGGGSGLPKARRYVRQLGIQQRVHFLGQVLDVSAMLHDIDVFAAPSNAETFGLVIAEAMAAHKPVVAYHVGGVPEVVADGCTGYLVRRGNTAVFAQRLAELAADRELTTNMGELGYQRVAELFSLKRITKKIISTYHEILEGAHA